MAEFFITFYFGCVIGSFLHVVATDLPINKNLFSRRSKCPSCNHVLSIIELFPLISYIIQHRRCRHCKTRISSLYFLSEFITGFCFVFPLFLSGTPVKYLVGFYLLITLVILISITDLKYGLIPNKILLFYFFLFLFISRTILQMIIIFLILLFLAEITSRISNKTTIGGGDIKLLTLLALFLPVQNFVLILFISSLSAIIYVLITQKKRIKFGPFIGFAALISYYLYLYTSFS